VVVILTGGCVEPGADGMPEEEDRYLFPAFHRERGSTYPLSGSAAGKLLRRIRRTYGMA
jgi:hypothetical protein